MTTKSIFFKLFGLLMMTALSLLSAQAQVIPVPVEDPLTAKAVKDLDISRLDLIRQVFPDAHIENDYFYFAIARQSIKLRNLFDGSEKKFNDRLSLAFHDQMETLEDGIKTLWVVINVSHPDIGPGDGCYDCSEKILAAFRLSKTEAQLIDAANVLTKFETEDEVEFDREIRTLNFAPHREAVLFWNFSNSHLNGDTISAVTIDGQNGFKVLINQFMVGRSYYWKCQKWYDEKAQLRLLKTARGGVRDVEILIRTEAGTGDYDFPKVKVRRNFRYLFTWEPGQQKYKMFVNHERRRHALIKKWKPDCWDKN